MHLVDIRKEYGQQLEQIKENRKTSNTHTFISDLLSKLAHHGKAHINFEHNYLFIIDYTIKQSRIFETDKNKLIDNIGTNLADLIEK